jgi:hypothetical protein
MNDKIKRLALRAGHPGYPRGESELQKFAELIIQSCIDKIETYRIPVGNSASGELACEWTYAALKEIRDDIKDTFGITDA